MREDSNDLVTIDYSLRDAEVVDYAFYRMPEIPGVLFRGPPVTTTRDAPFFTCLGAAQTLGIYVNDPFPSQLSRQIGMPAWNVGIGAASAGFFLEHDRIIERANQGRFVIVQVMTARADANDRFAPTRHADILHDRKRGDEVSTTEAWGRVTREEPGLLATYATQSQLLWARNYEAMMRRITVPIILFWFAPKRLNQPSMATASGGAGGTGLDITASTALPDTFPQMVDGACLSPLLPLADTFVACHSERGLPSPLASRFTGQQVEVDYQRLGPLAPAIKERTNSYYPSQEMHDDAAAALLNSVSTIIGRTPAKV